MPEEIKALIEQINDIDNGDDVIDDLEKAMTFFCSNWDICEGYKRAIVLTLEDQYMNHPNEQAGAEDIAKLKSLLKI